MIRRLLKRAVEGFLAHGGPSAFAASRRVDDTLILAYHNIVPDGVPRFGEHTLHLAVSQFRAQLDYLMQTHEVIDLINVRTASGAGSKPRVAITFDDAYRGALLHGLPELAARGLPATVFVAPGLLGSPGCWWDLLAALDGSGLPRAVRQLAIEELRGDSEAVLQWARSERRPAAELPHVAGIATESELTAAALTPGIRLAPHTWTHLNLEHLSPSGRGLELEAPLLWLNARYERVLPWLAYPYGLFSAETPVAAQAAGYEAALRIDGGWIPASSLASFVLPRFNVNADLSANGFILRASGLVAP